MRGGAGWLRCAVKARAAGRDARGRGECLDGREWSKWSVAATDRLFRAGREHGRRPGAAALGALPVDGGRAEAGQLHAFTDAAAVEALADYTDEKSEKRAGDR